MHQILGAFYKSLCCTTGLRGGREMEGGTGGTMVSNAKRQGGVVFRKDTGTDADQALDGQGPRIVRIAGSKRPWSPQPPLVHPIVSPAGGRYRR